MKELQEHMKALAKPAAQEIINVPEAVDSADPVSVMSYKKKDCLQISHNGNLCLHKLEF